jgi:hypothetical protein
LTAQYTELEKSREGGRQIEKESKLIIFFHLTSKLNK